MVANTNFVPGRTPILFSQIPRREHRYHADLSLASSPRDRGSIMIAMRMRVSEFKTTLLAAPNGTRFEVSRARGSFTLHQDPQRPAMFLAGGIGITPINSIIGWAGQQAHSHRMFLFYSNRKVEDAAFLENFEELARQNSRFRFVPTITNSVGPSWPYERGRIDAKMLTRRRSHATSHFTS
jgi:ferredoxin-NADP reductase